ncbi:MAG: ROK family protein [Elusimicrobia bacterium]|nr:ROK family protein [Elusimicrobiota bacterium]
MDRAGFAIGIDVGGTATKLAAADSSGLCLREIEIPTHAEHRPVRFVRRIASVIRLVESELGGPADGIGVGLAGDVDAARGVLRFAPNLRLWNGFNFKRAFERAPVSGRGSGSRRVVVDNDANAAVWGAYVMEMGRRPSDVVGITLGTGVGGGLIIGGRLHHGATGSAGEIGHVKVEHPGLRCRCGSRGCLEAYAGSYGIVSRARKLLRTSAGRKSPLKDLAPDPKDLDCRVLGLAAERRDPLALRVWAETARYLAIGISDLVVLLNPDAVVILGGVSRAGPFLLGPIKEHLAREPFRTAFEAVSVRVARNPHWGCVGAALLAWEAAGAASQAGA